MCVYNTLPLSLLIFITTLEDTGTCYDTLLRCVKLRYSTIKQLAQKMTAYVFTSKPSSLSLFCSHNIETASGIFSHKSRIQGLL